MTPSTPGAPSRTGTPTPIVDTTADDLSLAKTPLLPAERAMLRGFDNQRRVALLRIIVPALLVITVLAIPFALQADMMGGTFTSRLEVGIGVLGCALALWATRARRGTIASLMLFATITGVILAVLVTDGLVRGALDVSILPEFQLLLLPIAIAGVFGGPLLVIFATIVANTATLALIILTPHTAA